MLAYGNLINGAPNKKEDFDLETIQTPEPVENLYHIIKYSLKTEQECLQAVVNQYKEWFSLLNKKMLTEMC